MGATSTRHSISTKQAAYAARVLTNITTYDFHSTQAIKDGQKLPGGPAAHFCRSSPGSKGWVKYINVDGDVHLRALDLVLESINDTLHTNLVESPGCNQMEATGFIVAKVVMLAGYWTSYAGMY